MLSKSRVILSAGDLSSVDVLVVEMASNVG